MKKSNVAMLCVIFLLVGAIGGFFISNSLNSEPKNDMVGTYKTSTWNGKDATLVLNADGTCFYPSGCDGTWRVEGEKVVLDCPELAVPSLDISSIREATIVPKGILLSGHFFEKL
jgi:hypothetical protein